MPSTRLVATRAARRALVIFLAPMLLAPILLAAPSAAAGVETPPDRSARGSAQLAVVPLDDRPANVYVPAMTAASAGVDTAFPPSDIIGTFTTPGDGPAIGAWLLDQRDADGFVISVSMLAYGGLIASRTGTMSEAEARQNVDVLRELRARRPDTPILAYDTIQRLAVTALGDHAAEYYELIRQWAILVDRVENLGHEEYREEMEELRARIPDAVVEGYLAARARNHAINRLLVHWAAEGVVDHLVLAQDDAAPYGLHRAEREELVALVHDLGAEARVQIFPGADEVDATLVSRFVLARSGAQPTVSVEYSGLDGSQWTAPFEDTTYDVNIQRHIVAAGAVPVDDDGDIRLLVNTPSAEGADRGAELDAFVERMAALQAAGEDVVVVDAAEVNRADAALIDRMEADVSLSGLLSYCGWNTAGNALGMAVGHAFARWSLLERPRQLDVASLAQAARVHASYLLYRYVLDDRWKNVVQPEAYARAQERGWNVFELTPEQTQTMQDYVRAELMPRTESFYAEHFAGRPVTIGRRGAHTFTGVVDGLESVHVALPWPRLFETELEPDVTLRWPHR